ncbi:MAG: hypothetical protein ACRDKC_00450 [Gaiellaceae bacterium]
MISEVLGDALAVYQRLWRRSVVVAGLVFAVVSLADAFAARKSTEATTLVSVILALVGGLLVQGALVEVVRDLHEGREPGPIGTYYTRTRGRLGTLLGASLLYGIGVAVGFLLLLVPGLIAVARWSLIVPLVVIERLGVGEAFSRSSQLVKGQTGRVLVLVVVSAIITGLVSLAVRAAFGFLPEFGSVWVGGTIASAIAVPYQAHVLTVLYYRLTEPERPVLPEEPTRETWRSVWDEEPPA